MASTSERFLLHEASEFVIIEPEQYSTRLRTTESRVTPYKIPTALYISYSRRHPAFASYSCDILKCSFNACSSVLCSNTVLVVGVAVRRLPLLLCILRPPRKFLDCILSVSKSYSNSSIIINIPALSVARHAYILFRQHHNSASSWNLHTISDYLQLESLLLLDCFDNQRIPYVIMAAPSAPMVDRFNFNDLPGELKTAVWQVFVDSHDPNFVPIGLKPKYIDGIQYTRTWAPSTSPYNLHCSSAPPVHLSFAASGGRELAEKAPNTIPSECEWTYTQSKTAQIIAVISKTKAVHLPMV